MNYKVVTRTIEMLQSNWDTDTYPGGWDGQKPEIIDQDNSSPESSSRRRESWELSDNNAVTVGSVPSVSQTAIGTEYDHRVEHGVSVTVEGVHESEFGHLRNGAEFSYLVEAARRAILAERVWPYRNPSGAYHYHSLFLDNPENNSSDNRDYFHYSFDVRFVGYEQIPQQDGYSTEFGEDFGSPESFGSDFGDSFDY